MNKQSSTRRGKYLTLYLLFIANTLAAQLATSVNVTGLQMPVVNSLVATTGGTLTAGTYFYIVTSVDSTGGQSSYARGLEISVSAPNNAVAIGWAVAAYAKEYHIYRSSTAFGGSWYLLATVTGTSYTDVGAAGSLSEPLLQPTGIGKIRGNSGVLITDERENVVIKSYTNAGWWGNYSAVQLGMHVVLGTTGIYGNNGALFKSLQGILFEGFAPYESDYTFKSLPGDLNYIYLRPKLQQFKMTDGAGNTRTIFDQNVEDGPSAVAFSLSTSSVLSNASAKLFSVKNQNTEHFSILASGNVGIGTIGSDAYKLSVNGNIRAKKVVVETGWSDYVFASDYKLRSLSSLKQYIAANKHLPDIPSAKQVEKEGVSIGDSQALLLKKIEELTLYMINLHEENEALKKRVRTLEEKRTIK